MTDTERLGMIFRRILTTDGTDWAPWIHVDPSGISIDGSWNLDPVEVALVESVRARARA